MVDSYFVGPVVLSLSCAHTNTHGRVIAHVADAYGRMLVCLVSVSQHARRRRPPCHFSRLIADSCRASQRIEVPYALGAMRISSPILNESSLKPSCKDGINKHKG